jgi:hypothetical protein
MDDQTTDFLQRTAKVLDQLLNGEQRGQDRHNGFVLLVFPFDGPKGARVNYVSNADRADVLVALKEVVARFEGRVINTTVLQ